MMRGTPGMRLVLTILSPIFVVLCFFAIRNEKVRTWMDYQEQFKQLYIARAAAKVSQAAARRDAVEKAHWQRVVDEVSAVQPEIGQIYIEDLRLAERCITCHRGIDNALFQDAPQPFRTHPGDLLKHHDINTFGCTLCHDGQGAAITVAGAHGRDAGSLGSLPSAGSPGSEANWLRPLLPTKYLQASCGRCHEVTHGVAKTEVVSRGANVFMEKGCYGCHQARGVDNLPKFGPPLTPFKSKLKDPQSWVYALIKDPATVSPNTAMPNFKLSEEDAGKITAFLMTLPAKTPEGAVELDGASPKDGERLFIDRGCGGCHAVKSDESSASPRVPHLARIGSKVTAEWLDRWIADPRSYNSETAMPKTELTDGERHALVAYLLTLTSPEPLAAPPDLGRFSPEDGKQLVRRYECFGCHAIAGFERGRPSVPDLGEFARRAVDELDFARTTVANVPRTKWDWLRHKLREPRAYETEVIQLRMPVTTLTEDDVQALVSYVLAYDTPALPPHYILGATPAQRARRELAWTTAQLNCNGCHQLNDQEPRIARLAGRTAATPPALDGVALRLQSQTLFQFVLDPKRARPWVGMRMPNFGLTETRARTLVDGFASVANITNPYADVATPSTFAPPLTTLPGKLANQDWLVAWLLKPSRLRPGTAMPDADPTADDAQAIARYLYAEAPPAKPPSPWQGGDPEIGKQLFLSRGCRGCHGIEVGDRSTATWVPHLAGIGLKVSGDWLFTWLKSPREYNPRTTMPQLTLSDDEIRHLIAFLRSHQEAADAIAAAPRFDPSGEAAKGRDVIERYGCARCHEVKGFPPPPPPFELTSVANATTGPEAVLRDGRMLVAYYNCRGCHRLEGSGGALAGLFERRTLAPPTLEREGARVQPSWLKAFLEKPEALRPWLAMRMPNFGFSEVQRDVLGRYFAALSGVPPADEPVVDQPQEITTHGLRRFAYFKCVQCHPTTLGAKPPAGVNLDDLSINLALAKKRLRPSWVRDFLARPKAIVGMQTRMPTSFFTVDGAPKVDEPDRDIAAITAYLFQMTGPPEAALAELRAHDQPGVPPPPTEWRNYKY